MVKPRDERLLTLRHLKERWFSAKLQIGLGKCLRYETRRKDPSLILVQDDTQES